MAHKKKNKDRGETWVGFRPSVIPARKGDTKKDRKVNKQRCRNIQKGEEE